MHSSISGTGAGPGGASPAATSYLLSSRPDSVRAGEGSGFVPARSVAGSEGGEPKVSGQLPCAHMMSVVVEDVEKQLQMFVKGDVEGVLDQCSLVWDGQELRPMLPADVKCILTHCSECYTKHYRCGAYSFVSLGAEKCL